MPTFRTAATRETLLGVAILTFFFGLVLFPPKTWIKLDYARVRYQMTA